jgi:hypothetical protein
MAAATQALTDGARPATTAASIASQSTVTITRVRILEAHSCRGAYAKARTPRTATARSQLLITTPVCCSGWSPSTDWRSWPPGQCGLPRSRADRPVAMTDLGTGGGHRVPQARPPLPGSARSVHSALLT